MTATQQFIGTLQSLKDGGLGRRREHAGLPLDQPVAGFDLFAGPAAAAPREEYPIIWAPPSLSGLLLRRRQFLTPLILGEFFMEPCDHLADPGLGQAPAGVGMLLFGLLEQCAAGSGLPGDTPARPRRPAVGRRSLPRSPGGNGRPCPQTAETRHEIRTHRRIGNVSAEFPSSLVSLQSGCWATLSTGEGRSRRIYD